jgi:hypothetical protein
LRQEWGENMKKLWLGMVVAFFLQVIPGFARGDKVIPQVADGTGIRTKFDLTNISPSVTISNFKLKFYRQNGSAWTVKTNLGTASEYALNIGPRQTLRIETQGASSPAISGYAMIEDNESNNSYNSVDYALGISVYYEISNSKGVVDTVSVPVGKPTALGTIPVEYTQAKGIYTGIAIVNLSASKNPVKIDLYPSGTGNSSTTTITLDPFQQRAEFFHESMFTALRTQDFKGLAEFSSDGPIALLALLQTNSYTGDVQYATLVPTDRMALRNNTYMLVPEATYVGTGNNSMPVDLDNFVVDFFRNQEENMAWDILYEGTGKTTRQLRPVNGAGFYPLGIKSDDEIDALSLPQLMSLNYTTSPIDFSDGKPALQIKYAFAVLTDLGQYAKVRLVNYSVFTGSDGNPFVDLMFEVTVYR